MRSSWRVDSGHTHSTTKGWRSSVTESESVIQAELQAIQLATTILQLLQVTYVLLCTDSQLSVSYIHQCHQHIPWRLRPLVSKIHRDTLNATCIFRKISRSSNSRAHDLATTAKSAINSGLGDNPSLTFSCAHQNDGCTLLRRVRDCLTGPCRLINITCNDEH